MASLGKLAMSALSGTIESTIALANINFDFSLIKMEAPREFHELGTSLSPLRREEAEAGKVHSTARKLGALFEAVLPSTPCLVKAYGLRASEISKSDILRTPRAPRYGGFGKQVGVDGTSLWAAATSGTKAITVHLLACMLARMWSGSEATSIWVEIVAGRKNELAVGFQEENFTSTSNYMAAQQELTREELANWDASARAWLRAADAVEHTRQERVEEILEKLNSSVNTRSIPYDSVISAWKTAITVMECLISGMPQQMETGEVILALLSWHLYPDVVHLGSSVKSIIQKDCLIRDGGTLTVGLERTDQGVHGIYWSLPLAHLRYYGDPVPTSRSLTGDPSRLSMDELLIAVLGCVFEGWGSHGSDAVVAAEYLVELATILNRELSSSEKGWHTFLEAPQQNSWLSILGHSARKFLDSSDNEHHTYRKLIALGRRLSGSFFNHPSSPVPLFVETRTFVDIHGNGVEGKVRALRKISGRLKVSSRDIFIRYVRPKEHHMPDSFEYATAIPFSKAQSSQEPLDSTIKGKGHIRWIVMDPQKGTGKTLNEMRGIPLLTKIYEDRKKAYIDQGEEVAAVENESIEEVTEGQLDPQARMIDWRQQDHEAYFNHKNPAPTEPAPVRRFQRLWGDNSLGLYFRYSDQDSASEQRKADRYRKQIERGVSLQMLRDVLLSDDLDHEHLLRQVLIELENTNWSNLKSLGALALAVQVYKLLPYATVDIRVLTSPLSNSKWAPSISAHHFEDSSNIVASFRPSAYLVDLLAASPDSNDENYITYSNSPPYLKDISAASPDSDDEHDVAFSYSPPLEPTYRGRSALETVLSIPHPSASARSRQTTKRV